jgi:nucleotide-binding universal stress UspA family protein
MHKKILAPLDGSRFSESSLEQVKEIVDRPGSPEVVLLMVLEPDSFSVGELAAANTKMATQVAIQTEQASKTKAMAYVNKIAEKLQKEGVSAKSAIVYGRPAEEILAYAEENKFDLIIMSTHGRSGISRWAFGSVAEEVIRSSSVPVLIASPLGLRTK